MVINVARIEWAEYPLSKPMWRAYFRRMRFELLDETRLTLRSQLQIPTMGNQVYQVNGELSASVSVESGSNCLELVRVDFTGHLEQLGRVRGALSYCAS